MLFSCVTPLFLSCSACAIPCPPLPPLAFSPPPFFPASPVCFFVLLYVRLYVFPCVLGSGVRIGQPPSAPFLLSLAPTRRWLPPGQGPPKVTPRAWLTRAMRAMSRVSAPVGRPSLVPGPAFTEAIMEAPRALLRDCAVGELKICTGVVTIHVLQIAFGPAGLVMLTVRCAMKGATELCRNGYLARYLFFLRVQ